MRAEHSLYEVFLPFVYLQTPWKGKSAFELTPRDVSEILDSVSWQTAEKVLWIKSKYTGIHSFRFNQQLGLFRQVCSEWRGHGGQDMYEGATLFYFLP